MVGTRGELDTLLDAELWQLSDAQLIAGVPAVTAQIHRLQALRVSLVGETDHRRVVPDPAHPALKHWLANTPAGMLSVSEASRIVSLARLLREQPDLAAAYESGGLRADLAVLIGAFCENPPKGMPVDIVPDIRKRLIDEVSHGTGDAAALRKSITDLRDAFAQTPPAEDTDRNEFYASQTLNGRVVIKGDVDSETGEMLLTALSKLSAPVPGPGGEPDPRPAALRRADAVTEMLRRFHDCGAGPVEGGEKPHLTVLVNINDLHHCDGGECGCGRDDYGSDDSGNGCGSDSGLGPQMMWTGPLSRASTRRLACDCNITPIIINNDGVPLKLGRKDRLVPASLRRALIVRDRCCAFPGCGRPAAWTDAHHIIHWADGGDTDLSNTVLLCRYHHRLIHHSEWEVFIGPDLLPWFRPPRSRDPDRNPLPAHGRTAA
ncbi:HNH endonuclease signature motif containing protein [Speluncibacter jeojiensis]|uniref:HNH endonuclease n=1 Tax=Speluncibacter jeojiensis TaxID=2710754 RepID=A0A9X4LY28_9ACTN|nr:HNH endonuclease [Corynebacteriales bacterium D3-21]